MEYKASLDNIAKILTVGVFVLFVVIGWQSAKSLLSGDNDTLVVNRAIGNVKFKIDAITQVRVLTDGELN